MNGMRTDTAKTIRLSDYQPPEWLIDTVDLDVSLFKSLGMGVADLALASLIFERAVARGVGREIERMGRSTARWRSARRH